MREIKFRAWDKVEKRMRKNVGVIKHSKGTYGILPGWCGNCPEVKWLEPESHEFMQFTGLHDKNGKDIYEGDIIKIHTHWSRKFEGKIEVVEMCDIFCSGDYTPREKDVEVIGNIYENPDLIKHDN